MHTLRLFRLFSTFSTELPSITTETHTSIRTIMTFESAPTIIEPPIVHIPDPVTTTVTVPMPSATRLAAHPTPEVYDTPEPTPIGRTREVTVIVEETPEAPIHTPVATIVHAPPPIPSARPSKGKVTIVEDEDGQMYIDDDEYYDDRRQAHYDAEEDDEEDEDAYSTIRRTRTRGRGLRKKKVPTPSRDKKQRW